MFIHTYIYIRQRDASRPVRYRCISKQARDWGRGGEGGGAVTVAYQGGVGGSIRSHFLSVNCILCDTLSRSN